MFPSGKVEAEQKFWQTAELVQGLLPYLDLESTLRLAHTHQKIQAILQGSRVWTNLVKRSSPLNQLDKVEHLVDILKLLEDTESNMLDLLDTICEANPGDSMDQQIWINCPRHPTSYHSISVDGFLLLEKVEGAFGTTEQTVWSIRLHFVVNGPLLSALASRLSRQQQKLTTFYIGTIELSSKKEAEDFKTLLQACSPMNIGLSRLNETDIGREGWGRLAEGLQSYPALLSSASVQKGSLELCRKEDLRVLWDALRPDGVLVVEERATMPEISEISRVQESCEKVDGEAGWIRLCQIKDQDFLGWIHERWDQLEAEMLESDEEGEEDEGDEEEEEEGDEGEGEGDEEVGEQGEEADEQVNEGQGDEA